MTAAPQTDVNNRENQHRSNQRAGGSVLAEIERQLRESNLPSRQTFETLSFGEYIERVKANPVIAGNAYQRLFAAIQSYGSSEVEDGVASHAVFKDPFDNGKHELFGLKRELQETVNFFKGAAEGGVQGRRMLWLVGPNGSGKSTVVRQLKQALEAFAASPEGMAYEIGVSDTPLKDGAIPEQEQIQWSEWGQEPLLAIPRRERPVYCKVLSDPERGIELEIDGEVAGQCGEMLSQHPSDWSEYVRIRPRRYDIGASKSFATVESEPQQQAGQNDAGVGRSATQAVIAEKFKQANRGIIEFSEMLQFDENRDVVVNLLSATQEHKVGGVDIDTVIIAHANEPGLRRLVKEEKLAGLKDRSFVIHIPYGRKLDAEIKIYERDFGPKNLRIVPHTLEVGAMFAVLSRLEKPASSSISLMQKLKIYNGKQLPGFTTKEQLRELETQAPNEGMTGVSPRYVQDKISQALARPGGEYVSPYSLLSEIKIDMKQREHAAIAKDDKAQGYLELLGVVEQHLEEVLKHEIQSAAVNVPELAPKVFTEYLKHMTMSVMGQKIKNEITGTFEEPSESMMRGVEQYMDIPESQSKKFRAEVMNRIGALATENKRFEITTNERLKHAIELKILNDNSETLQRVLKGILDGRSANLDQALIDKIEETKQTLVKHYGYTERSATDMLYHFARQNSQGK